MRPAAATVAALASLPLCLAGCGGGDGGGSGSGGGEAAPAAASVEIADFEYAPAEVRVRAGGTVRFANRDRASHTATAERGFDTGRLERDASREVRFAEAGRFAYVCTFHPYMKGTVVAEEG